MEAIQLMNVKRQHEAYASEYEKAALEVLRSGLYIGGPEVVAFEEEFANYAGAKYGISCGNGTDALVLALKALGIGIGDEVITVSFTFFGTAESIAAVGATPVFVDVCEDNFCIDPNLIEEKITYKTKAILVVHIYGHSADMDRIKEIARKYNIKIISDCAQSTGTKYKGSRKGTLGDVSCFSFFPTKNLGCDGDGGMILTDDPNVACACKSYKVHGSGKDGLNTLKRKYKQDGISFPDEIPVGSSKYYNYLIGCNSRLDAIQAAILRKKLLHINDFIEGRRRNALLYNEALKSSSYKLPTESEFSEHSYYIYALQHEKASDIMERLKDKGVPCGTYYPIPLHLQGAFFKYRDKKASLPVTEYLCKTSFAIPVFPELYDKERNYIIQKLKECENEI